MVYYRTWRGVSACALLAALSAVAAAQVNDAGGDFLPSYTGPQGGDLDVLSANVALNGDNLIFSSTLAAPIGTTPGALFVFGVDRGQGAPLLASGTPPLGLDILFDSVVIIRADGTGTVSKIVGGGANTIDPANISIVGDTFTATVPTSFLPSLGFTPINYTWNLWPRVGTGQNVQISDFAPDTGNAPVVPEPATALLLGTLTLACVVRRR